MVDATDQPLMIWKTLAISEHLSERFLAHPIWPIDPDLCAPAHSLGAEMQCSFAAPRNHCRMHIGINLSHRGRILWRDTPAVQANIGAKSRSAPRFYLDPTGRIWPARLAKLMFFGARYHEVGILCPTSLGPFAKLFRHAVRLSSGGEPEDSSCVGG